MDYNEFMKKIAWSDIQYWILAFIIGAILLSFEGFGMPTTQMPVISMFVLVILIIHLSINLIIYLFKEIVIALFNKKLNKKRIRVIPSLILICFTGSVTYSWSMAQSKIDKRMHTIANEVQNICVEQQKCPLSLTQLFDDVKLIKPQSIFTEAGTEDEIADNPTSIEAAGYNLFNDGSSRTYTYKLKPYYGLTAFNFRVSSSSFLISWIAHKDDAESINISGGINSELLKIGPCRQFMEDCKTKSGYEY